VTGDAERAGHASRRLDLGDVALAIGERQRVEGEAVARRQRGRGRRVDAAAQQHDRPRLALHAAIV